MSQHPKLKKFVRVIQFILVIFGAYLALSLFEVWAFFPFWVKNLALAINLGAIYWFIRKNLSRGRPPAPVFTWPLHAFSIVVLGFLIWGALHVGSGVPGRIMQALTFSLKQPPSEVAFTLKVTPPAYLNQPAVILISKTDGPFSRLEGGEVFTFPEGSIISVEINTGENYTPFISLDNSLGQTEGTGDAGYRSQHILLEDATLDIQVGPYVAIRLPFTVIPDQAPEITLSAVETKRNSLEWQFNLEDDHGIEAAWIELTNRGLIDTKTEEIKIPVLDFTASGAPGKFYLNLLAHPWAGSSVTGVIKAVDGLGQISTSNQVSITLPEKSFKNPVAQSLASIRKALFVMPERKNAQVRRLDQVTNDKAAYGHDTGIYLSLRSAYWKLRSAETDTDIEEVTRYLWQTALRLEDDGSFEEQSIQVLLGRLRVQLIEGGDLEKFDLLAGNLQAKMEDMFGTEFRLVSRRLSLNEGPDQIAIPELVSFRDLLNSLRAQASNGEDKAALKSLMALQALFEQRPIMNF